MHMAEDILAELEQAVGEISKAQMDQIDLAVLIEKGKTVIKKFTDIVEEFEQKARERTPVVEAESLATRAAKIAELKAGAGLQ